MLLGDSASGQGPTGTDMLTSAFREMGPPSQCSKSPELVSMGRWVCRHGRSMGSPSRLAGRTRL